MITINQYRVWDSLWCYLRHLGHDWWSKELITQFIRFEQCSRCGAVRDDPQEKP